MPKYNDQIDMAIITELFENEPLAYLELKRRVEKAVNMKKGLSKSVYSHHINNLKSEAIIEADDSQGRGRPVLYRLTDRSKQELRLGIIKVRSADLKVLHPVYITEEEKQRKLYEMLLFFEARTNARSVSERELDALLFKLNTTRDKLTVFQVTQDNGDKHTIFNPIEGVVITESYSKQTGKREYSYRLPGHSIAEVLTNRYFMFHYLDLSREELDVSIDKLCRERILTVVGKFDGELRYGIKDPSLRGFVHYTAYLYSEVLNRMMLEWRYKRKATKEERDWLEWVLGKHNANRIINECYFALRDFQKRSEVTKVKSEIDKEIERNESAIAALLHVLNKIGSKVIHRYPYPVESLLKLVILPLRDKKLWTTILQIQENLSTTQTHE